MPRPCPKASKIGPPKPHRLRARGAPVRSFLRAADLEGAFLREPSFAPLPCERMAAAPPMCVLEMDPRFLLEVVRDQADAAARLAREVLG